MKNHSFSGLKPFLLLWSTQALSALGSAMTSFALIIWSYQQQGSALTTALLSVCSYAPYVLLSIFVGALSDRWNKKRTMLICDSLAAVTTLCVWLLFRSENLQLWNLYLVNALNGVMNSFQQPASEVAVSVLTPKKQYQRVAGMRSFSNSLVTILTPVFATAIFTLVGMDAVILFDLISFSVAFLSLAFFIRIPDTAETTAQKQETFWKTTQGGLCYLRKNQGLLHLILFLSAINLVASMYEAALPAMLLSRDGGGQTALGMVQAFTGVANILGSVLATILPAPKSRVRVICLSLLFSMSTENFFLAFGRSIPVWCIGAMLGWLMIPLMNANMDVLFRSHIPIAMQGRVYAVRNALQFFTIPLGYLLGGILVDDVFEPFMQMQSPESVFTVLFGIGKGSGAAMLFGVLAIAGIGVCLYFCRDKAIWALDKQ